MWIELGLVCLLLLYVEYERNREAEERGVRVFVLQD